MYIIYTSWKLVLDYWYVIVGRAKRAPTLGCSIEILRDIYICMSVSLRETHTKNTYAKMCRACSKSVLGGKTDL